MAKTEKSTAYKVIYPCAGADAGDVVTEDDLGGVNIPALVSSGHLAVDHGSKAKEDSKVEPAAPAASAAKGE